MDFPKMSNYVVMFALISLKDQTCMPVCFYLHIVHVCIVSMQLLLYKTDLSLIHNVWMDVTDGL